RPHICWKATSFQQQHLKMLARRIAGTLFVVSKYWALIQPQASLHWGTPLPMGVHPASTSKPGGLIIWRVVCRRTREPTIFQCWIRGEGGMVGARIVSVLPR